MTSFNEDQGFKPKVQPTLGGWYNCKKDNKNQITTITRRGGGGGGECMNRARAHAHTVPGSSSVKLLVLQGGVRLFHFILTRPVNSWKKSGKKHDGTAELRGA